MTVRIWDRFLTDQDRAIFDQGGFSAPMGFGKRPCILVVDANYDFVGREPVPVLEAAKRWHNSSGAPAWAAVQQIKRLLAEARAVQIPVIYTNISRRPDKWDSGVWKWKNRRNFERAAGKEGGISPIVREIEPEAEDLVVLKHRPSAFFGTPALSHLIELGADTIIVCGGTTSGCVRASVVDAFSNNLRSIVVEDACFDRGEASHAISLFDMNAKYADVVSSDAVATYLRSLPGHLFPGRPGRKSPGEEI